MNGTATVMKNTKLSTWVDEIAALSKPDQVVWADGDWRLLWNDRHVFPTRDGYRRFKESWNAHRKVQLETTHRGQS